MALPGVTVRSRETPTPASVPTDTTRWFITGISERGPLRPVLIRSLSEFIRLFGDRVSYGIMYDVVDTFFREGGSSVYISRVVGPAPTLGVLNINDNAAAVSLIVSAVGPGAYSTGIKVGIVAGSVGGTYQVQVTDAAGNLLEQSGDLITQADAIAWSQGSDYVRIAIGASALPPAVIAPAALSAGNDDRAAITEAQWTAALALFTADLGSGQVSAPGRTTDAAHTALLAHAAANRRDVLLDLADTNTTGTLKTAVVNARVGNQRYGAAFAPWDLIPGVIPGTTRTVPPSARQAGTIARNEAEFGPDSPSAGDKGVAKYVTGVTQTWTDAQREDLNNNGVNVSLKRNGIVQTYGWRSLVNATADPNWVDFGNSRLFMAIAADANEIAEGYVFRVIDGQGHTQSEFGGDLTAMLLGYYTNGNLYGATPSEAFSVDVGAQVNTPESIARNELHAVLNVRMSPFAEMVVIEIVKTSIAQGVI